MGLTGVPRSFSIALMGLSEVTGGNQSQGVFFSAGLQVGNNVYGTQQFSILQDNGLCELVCM